MGYIDYINTSRTLIYNLNICSLNLSLFFGEGMRCGMANLQYKCGHSCHSYFYSIEQISPAKFVQIQFPPPQLSDIPNPSPIPQPTDLPTSSAHTAPIPRTALARHTTRPEDANTTENQRKK